MDTVVIGLDGGEWDVLDRLLDRGEVPNLAALVESGYAGPLSSITPPVSPPAWTSIQTGTNPGKHGVFDFQAVEPDYGTRSIDATDRQATPFWTVMNDQGVSTGLFKVPFTYPPEPVDGFAVSGFPTPSTATDFARPASVAERVGPPERLFENRALLRRDDPDALRDDLLAVAERQTEALLDLLETRDPDVLMAVYDGCDRIQHFFWKYFDQDHPHHEHDEDLADAIPAYYRTVDRGIGRILDAVDGEPNVIVISDHGFGPLAHDVYVEKWLRAEGYLARTNGSTPSTSDLASTAVRRAWTALRAAGVAPIVREALPERLLATGRRLESGASEGVDWGRTTAFFGSLSGQSIYVNREDRFDRGTVSAAAYPAVVESLRDALADLRHPETGERLVEAVYHRDELFDGWATDAAPDLLVRTAPGYTLKDGRSSSLVAPATQYGQDRSGDHRTDGVLVASGPAFGEGTVADASVLDVAPTLLALQGCPVPETMDGTVLSSLFRGSVDVASTDEYGRATRASREWSDAERDELQQQLTDLGYM